ncbi:Mucin-associated surface protein (MASP), subgroup S012 [Trypanosoma cruzi]|nr:Mucin-associated surface protein (MASP), subgroup S012 [Trypanosoma cruzi]
MAMMMTGRVLLVCALCVLWCGVSVANGDTGNDLEHSGQGDVGIFSHSSSSVVGHGDNGVVTDGNFQGSGSHSPGFAPNGGKTSLTGVVEGVGLKSSKDALTPAEEGRGGMQGQQELVPKVSHQPEAGTTGKSHHNAPEQLPNAKTELGNGGGATAEGDEVKTTVKDAQLGRSSTNDSHPPAADRGLKEQEGTVRKATSTVALTPAVGRETPPKADPKEDSPKEKAASSAGVTQDSPTVSQQQTHSSSSSQSGIDPTYTPGEGRDAEEIFNNNQPSGGVVVKEGAQHETVAGSEKPTIPAANTRNTIGTTISGDSNSSTATITALRSDAGTEGTPTTNHLNRPSTEGATPPETNSDGEAVSANKYDTLSQSAGSTTAQTTNAKPGDTAKPVDSDSSTAVSHTTSPLLLLLLVACAAAAAVVAV